MSELLQGYYEDFNIRNHNAKMASKSDKLPYDIKMDGCDTLIITDSTTGNTVRIHHNDEKSDSWEIEINNNPPYSYLSNHRENFESFYQRTIKCIQ